MPPTGFKRSRALWDNARRESTHNPSDKFMRLLRAVAYELQPVRLDELNTQTWVHQTRYAFRSIASFIVTTLPYWAGRVLSFVKNMSLKQWLIVAGVILYYGVVRWVHYLLDAGPVMIIVTVLIAIFTVGLGDNQDPDGLSAYSVFNKGFAKIMGSVDAEALLAQHVGGGMVMPGMGGPAFHNDDNNDEPAMRQGRRRPRQAAQQAVIDDEPNNNNERAPENAAAAEPAAAPRARPPGKKARRRDLEQRREAQREIQLQREAATAMGFGEGDGQDVVAMQQLIPDQVAHAENE